MAEIEDHSEDPNWAPKQDMSLLCRVCANQHDYLIPIFEGEGLDHDMPNKMEKHLPIKVRENDKLPTQMCYQCASTIIAWSDLHTNCLEANKKLNHMLKINEKKFVEMGPEDEDAASDHYEDTYEAPSGGGDEDDEDFEKEIKQLISDAGVELDSSSSGTSKFRKILPKPTSKQVASKTPSKPAKVSRKRKSETSTPVKKESKKSKSDVGASSSGTVALLKPKEENVNSDDRCMIWSCCKCVCYYSSWFQLSNHLLSHTISYSDSDIKQETQCDIKILPNVSCQLCSCSIDKHSSYINTRRICQCFYCEELFTDKLQIELHIKLEHRNSLLQSNYWYTCLVCYAKLFKRVNDIRRHMQDDHYEFNFNVDQCVVKSLRDITFPCIECGVLCVLSRYCSKHKDCAPVTLSTLTSKCDEHSRLFPNCHSCQECGESFSDCKILWTHMYLQHEDSEFVCNLCPVDSKVVMKYPHILGRHMKKHNLSLKLKEALENIRKKSTIFVNGFTRYKCFQCPSVLSGFKNLKSHLEIHSGEKDFICEYCNATFDRPYGLKKHVNVVHGRQRDYKCEHCERTFSNAGGLGEHKYTYHSAENHFKCDLCPESFPSRGKLKVHRFSHGGVKYVCSICGNSFKNLKRHIKTVHTKEPKSVCDICGSELKSPALLKAHLSSVHTTSRPFICDVCSATYKCKKHLTAHYKKHQKLG